MELVVCFLASSICKQPVGKERSNIISRVVVIMCDIILGRKHKQQKMMKNIRMFRDRNDVSIWPSSAILSIILLESEDEEEEERNDGVDERNESS